MISSQPGLVVHLVEMCPAVPVFDSSAPIIHWLFVTLAAGLSLGENIPGICCQLSVLGERAELGDTVSCRVQGMMGDFTGFLGMCFLGK